jgi:restriction system protein
MLPNKDNLHLPLLKVLSDMGGTGVARDVVEKVKKSYPKLTPDDIASTLESGGNRLNNRIRWAKQDLVISGDIDATTGWGVWRITKKGTNRLAKEWSDWKPQYVTKPILASANQVTQTVADDPEEALYGARRELVKKIELELLQKIRSVGSDTFESLVAQLLEKMEYGSRADGTIKVTGKTGDGGIDGEFSFDRLGLYKAKFQAKKWKADRLVSPKEVRDFIGALDTERVGQGLFVTTSDFTSEAKAQAAKSGKVKLINGEEFARLAVEHELGVRKEPLSIPRVDEDFFASLD